MGGEGPRARAGGRAGLAVTPTLAILGALGGVVAFVAGVWALLAGIFKMITSTDANTRALNALTKRVDAVVVQVDDNRERIARLERGGPGGGHPRGGRR